MILNDSSIASLAEQGMVADFDPKLVNPTSLDLEIGCTLKIMRPVQRDFTAPTITFDKQGNVYIKEQRITEIEWKTLDISDHTKGDPVYVPPDMRFLACSKRVINMPKTVAALSRLKSSRGREFWEHMDAGWVDPGWNGSTLTMELINHSSGNLPIYPGMPMVQLIFMTCEVPVKGYDKIGRYNGDRLPTESKGIV